MQYHIKDKEWEVIYKNLSQEKRLHTKNIEKLRIFYEAICYTARTGCQWRFIPSDYGDWRALQRRFFRWSGVWDRPDMEAVMIDGTIVRAHACAAGYKKASQKEQALGRCVGGFTKVKSLQWSMP